MGFLCSEIGAQLSDSLGLSMGQIVQTSRWLFDQLGSTVAITGISHPNWMCKPELCCPRNPFFSPQFNWSHFHIQGSIQFVKPIHHKLRKLEENLEIQKSKIPKRVFPLNFYLPVFEWYFLEFLGPRYDELGEIGWFW